MNTVRAIHTYSPTLIPPYPPPSSFPFSSTGPKPSGVQYGTIISLEKAPEEDIMGTFLLGDKPYE